MEGRLQTRQWEKDGEKKYTTEIRADRVVLLGGGVKDTGPRHVSDEEIAASDNRGNQSDPIEEEIPF